MLMDVLSNFYRALPASRAHRSEYARVHTPGMTRYRNVMSCSNPRPCACGTSNEGQGNNARHSTRA
jgi:hypothetical protein